MYNIQELRSYLYIICGEKEPVNASNEWYAKQDPFMTKLEDYTYMNSFLIGVEYLMNNIFASMDETEIQFHFYEAAKSAFGEDKNAIREFFKLLYAIVFEKTDGPRWGQFVYMIGVNEFLNRLDRKMKNLIPFTLF